jgi:hypothetical protein
VRTNIIGRIAGTTLTVAAIAMGVGYDVAHTDADHSAPVQLAALSGTSGPIGGTVYVVSHLNSISGDEVREPPRDVRGHAVSFMSPRREAKGTPQRQRAEGDLRGNSGTHPITFCARNCARVALS